MTDPELTSSIQNGLGFHLRWKSSKKDKMEESSPSGSNSMVSTESMWWADPAGRQWRCSGGENDSEGRYNDQRLNGIQNQATTKMWPSRRLRAVIEAFGDLGCLHLDTGYR